MTAPVRDILGSWLLEGLGWFAIGEAFLRASVEAALCLALLLAGWSVALVLLAWILAHTVLWFLFYGGYAKLASLGQRRRPLPRLLAFRDRILREVQTSRAFRAAVMYGSGARGALNEQSDVDIIVVPSAPFPGGVLQLWALRAGSVLRRMPLEASAFDLERHLRFRMMNQTVVVVKSVPGAYPSIRRGALVAFSGIDGSGKTTVAKEVVARLEKEGIPARYFYGHRQYFRQGERNVSLAIAFKGTWRHLGHSLKELREHPRLALVLQVLTLVDYGWIQFRLARLLRPGTLVIADRYVADVIAYLRSFLPSRQAVEGLLSAISFPPDVPLLFELDAALAYGRKREETEEDLRATAGTYEDLARLLGLTRIDAGQSVADVTSAVLREVRSRVDLGGIGAEGGAG